MQSCVECYKVFEWIIDINILFNQYANKYLLTCKYISILPLYRVRLVPGRNWQTYYLQISKTYWIFNRENEASIDYRPYKVCIANQGSLVVKNFVVSNMIRYSFIRDSLFFKFKMQCSPSISGVHNLPVESGYISCFTIFGGIICFSYYF